MNTFLCIGAIYWFTVVQFLCTNALVELTNVECITTDKSFADFEYCYIKAINRTYKYLSLKVNLFKVPINNVTVKIATLKRANGYKPFLYNISFDACKFLRARKNIVYKYAYSFIEKHSNMNHTCPFDHDLIVEKVDIGFLNNQLTEILPVPDGEYAVYTTWIAYNVVRAYAKIYARVKNSF